MNNFRFYLPLAFFTWSLSFSHCFANKEDRIQRLNNAQFQSALLMAGAHTLGYLVGYELGTGVKVITTAGTAYFASLGAIELSIHARYKYTAAIRKSANQHRISYSSSQIAMLAGASSLFFQLPSTIFIGLLGWSLPIEIIDWELEN